MQNGSHGSDQRMKDENAEIIQHQLKGGCDLIELSSDGWTNEKHMLYLSSMEASFVDQLYNNNNNYYYNNNNNHNNNNNNNFRDLCGWSDEKPELTLASSDNQLLHGQFKVLREGRWKVLGYTRDRNESSNEAAENGSSNNFTSNPWIQRLRSSGRNNLHDDQMNDSESEVSDQNFVDEEIEKVAESSSTRPTKRHKTRAPF